MSDEMIHVEEEVKDVAHKVEATAKRWSEEISVRGGDLGDTLGRLMKEATVRKITIRSQSGKTLLEVPLALGVVGMAFLGPWTAGLLIGAWLARVSILIEYEAAPAKAEEMIEEAAQDVKAAIA